MSFLRQAAALFVLLGAAASCSLPFGREYEYEEQLYLDVDGSADVVINSSLPALVALRGLPLNPSARAPFESSELRRLYESMGCQVTRIGRPWYRHGRRFVQVRLTTGDITRLGRCTPLGWSTYRFTKTADAIRFQQIVGPSAGGHPGDANWTGAELVAFRVHVPSKVSFHNVRRLSDNATGGAERGNILTWEQRLVDRRAAVPVDMQVTMDPQSILHRTLWLFAGSFLAAVTFLGSLIWWTVRKGRRRAMTATRETR